MSDTPHLDALIQVADELENQALVNEYAELAAVGVFADDWDTPTICATVWRNKLLRLDIADAWAETASRGEDSWSDVGVIIGGVIVNAFMAWHASYDYYRTTTAQALQDNPGPEAVEELREAIAELRA